MIRKIHTSGHSTVEDMKRVVDAIRPNKIVPIHTAEMYKFEGHFDKRVSIKLCNCH